VFVKPNYEDAGTLPDGSYSAPFGHIAKAIEFALDTSSDKTGADINIYLLAGDTHHMTTNFAHFHYERSKSNKFPSQLNIVIQPALWTQLIGGHQFSESDSDWVASGGKVTVNYKMGGMYSFLVPSSLRVMSVMFDAVDSSIDPSSPCLKENSRWWVLEAKTLVPFEDGTYSCELYSSQTEECYHTFGNSLFQFTTINTQSDTEGVGTLTLENCEFENFFYEFTSFIGLANGHGHTNIQNSIFKKFSNWGSIIRDQHEVRNLDYSSTDDEIMQAQYRSSMMGTQASIKRNVELPSQACVSTTCTIIKIADSEFSDFNYLKSELLYLPKVVKSSKMASLGVILDLQDYCGRVTFDNNKVYSVQFNFKDWNIRNNDTYSDWRMNSSDEHQKVTQLKAAIYINMKVAEVEIINSSFEQWNSVSGVVYISKQTHSSGPLLIDSNNFIENSAFEGANAIRINMTLDVDEGTHLIGNKMVWAGVQISRNMFSRNIGVFNTAGVIQATWYANPLYDTNFTVSDEESSDPSLLLLQKIDKNEVVNFDDQESLQMPTSGIDVRLHRFELNSNTYDQNYAGMTTSVVDIIGILRIYIYDDVFTNNGGVYQEALSMYGTIDNPEESADIYEASGAWKLHAYYLSTPLKKYVSQIQRENHYPLSTLSFKSTYYIYTSRMSFDNNAFPELDLEYQVHNQGSQVISFHTWRGNIYLDSLTISNYRGMDTEMIAQITKNPL